MADGEDFIRRLEGRFSGILRWPQLDALWERVRACDGGWYFYLVGEPVPRSPIEGSVLAQALGELDGLLRREHEHDYCGIVYADDRANPSLIKVYDPHHLGASCGSSGLRILPRWLLSKQPPSAIEEPAPLPGNLRRWWQALFGEAG